MSRYSICRRSRRRGRVRCAPDSTSISRLNETNKKTIKRDFHTGAHTIPSLNLGSLAELASPFGARAAAPAFLADQAFFHARLTLPVVVGNVVGAIAPVSVDLARIVLLAAAVSGLYLVALSQATAAARRPRPGPRPVLLADQALGDPRLAFSVIIGDVVGIVSAISIDLSGVELASAAVIGFDLIALAEITASAVGIAAPAVERRDEAGFDARLGFAIVLCERLSEKDGKK